MKGQSDRAPAQAGWLSHSLSFYIVPTQRLSPNNKMATVNILRPRTTLTSAPSIAQRNLYTRTVSQSWAAAAGKVGPGGIAHRGSVIKALLSDRRLVPDRHRVTAYPDGGRSIFTLSIEGDSKPIVGTVVDALVELDHCGLAQKTTISSSSVVTAKLDADVSALARKTELYMKGLPGLQTPTGNRIGRILGTLAEDNADWAPLYMRLCSGAIAVLNGQGPNAAAPAGVRNLRELVPDLIRPPPAPAGGRGADTFIDGALSGYNVSEYDASHTILVHRDTTRGIPVGAYQVLANMHLAYCGLGGNMAGNVPLTWVRNMPAVPPLMILGMAEDPLLVAGLPNTPANGALPAQMAYNAGDLGDYDNWVAAIQYVLLQTGDYDAFYRGLYDAIDNGAHFFGPEVVHLSYPANLRFSAIGQDWVGIYLNRLRIMRMRQGGAELTPGEVGQLTALGIAAVETQVGGAWNPPIPAAPGFVGRMADELHHNYWVGTDLGDRAAFEQALSRLTTQQLECIIAYCASQNEWRGAWVPAGGHINNVHVRLNLPAGVAQRDYQQYVTSGRYRHRGYSLRACGLISHRSVQYPTGLEHLREVVQGTSATRAELGTSQYGRGPATTLRSLLSAGRMGQLVHSVAVNIRAAADAAVTATGVCRYQVALSSGQSNTGIAGLDAVLQEVELEELCLGHASLVQAYCQALDNGLANAGISGGYLASAVAMQGRISLQLGKDDGDLNLMIVPRALHEVVQQGLLPEVPLPGGAPLGGRHLSKLGAGISPIYGLKYGSDVCSLEVVSHLRRLAFMAGHRTDLNVLVNVADVEAGVAPSNHNLMPQTINDIGGVRDSDTFPGMPALCTDYISFCNFTLPSMLAFGDCTPIEDHHYYLDNRHPLYMSNCNRDNLGEISDTGPVFGLPYGGNNLRSPMSDVGQSAAYDAMRRSTKDDTRPPAGGRRAPGAPTRPVAGGPGIVAVCVSTSRYVDSVRMNFSHPEPILSATRHSAYVKSGGQSLTKILGLNTLYGYLPPDFMRRILMVQQPDAPRGGGPSEVGPTVVRGDANTAPTEYKLGSDGPRSPASSFCTDPGPSVSEAGDGGLVVVTGTGQSATLNPNTPPSTALEAMRLAAKAAGSV